MLRMGVMIVKKLCCLVNLDNIIIPFKTRKIQFHCPKLDLLIDLVFSFISMVAIDKYNEGVWNKLHGSFTLYLDYLVYLVWDVL
jgi:hypothetical protein